MNTKTSDKKLEINVDTEGKLMSLVQSGLPEVFNSAFTLNEWSGVEHYFWMLSDVLDSDRPSDDKIKLLSFFLKEFEQFFDGLTDQVLMTLCSGEEVAELLESIFFANKD